MVPRTLSILKVLFCLEKKLKTIIGIRKTMNLSNFGHLNRETKRRLALSMMARNFVFPEGI